MTPEDAARKIVFDRRGEIYPKWKKELPLALEIVQSFIGPHGLAPFLLTKDIQEHEGLPQDSMRIEVSGWLTNELSTHSNAWIDYKDVMPGALRRARKFLVAGLKRKGYEEKDLARLNSTQAVLSGQHAYQAGNQQYCFVPMETRNGGRLELPCAIREMSRVKGISLNESRAHRCFRNLRRREVAWCIGAGDGYVYPYGTRIYIKINENTAYNRIQNLDPIDLKSPQSLKFIQIGEKVIQQAIDKIRELEAQRQARLIEKAREIEETNATAIQPVALTGYRYYQSIFDEARRISEEIPDPAF